MSVATISSYRLADINESKVYIQQEENAKEGKDVSTGNSWHKQKDLGRPVISIQEGIVIATQYYDAAVGQVEACVELDSERDRNFKITNTNKETYVLKISNTLEQESALDMQEKCWQHLRNSGVQNVPQLVPSDSGSNVTALHEGYGNGGKTLLCRLVKYVEGETLSSLKKVPQPLWMDLGAFLGSMSSSLESFHHPASHCGHIWDIRQGEAVVEECFPYLKNEAQVLCIKRCLQRYKAFCSSFKHEFLSLRESVIHGDCNDDNVITSDEKFTSLIDYGDMCLSFTVGEIPIAAAYASLFPGPLENIQSLIRAYHKVFRLNLGEILFLLPLICLRLCVSCSISARNAKENSENDYLQVSSSSAWTSLQRFGVLRSEEIFTFIKDTFSINLSVEEKRKYQLCWDFDQLEDANANGADDETKLVRNLRSNLLPSNLSLMYDQPLHMVRGSGCYLYDQQGNAYLDGVNNVPHVGHSNPKVAKAVSEAMHNLNTNTRYLRTDLVDYAKDLVEMLPKSLEVIYFCNSGSEANDLALRIAREAGSTNGQTDVVVMNGAYHGHTASCIEISPYKFNRKGGKGKPERTHIMNFPDTCRELFMDGHVESSRVLQNIKDLGRNPPAAFISESLLSCGGQVILPDGYLKDVYANMKAAGAICIADEVQCGFGRCGSRFWGFETQGVVPDIVVMGKSIGNGFPLSAIVTTRKLADTFANGMEYFNTFGGCNAAIAAGHSVLKILKEDKLQQHSATMGKFLLEELKEITKSYPFIGDVRGQGLFAGIEFVTDGESKGYAPNLARFVCNKIKSRFILLNTDGMHSSVIKIKPPLVFTVEDAHHLINTIRTVLEEDLTEEHLADLLNMDREYNAKLN
jgi:4-aminobutyrate aminotransferase-like enzyme/Ser/Thr protein kinase RdoA (MazF antagonist)